MPSTDDLSPVEIRTLSSLQEVLGDVTDLYGDKSLFWRGHANFDWKLRAEVFRDVPSDEPDEVVWHDEPALLRGFMAQAESRHPRCPPPDDLAAWLMLARHYGLPTRILDWSYSPLVALFFAVQEPRQEPRDVDGCLWVLQPQWMNAQYTGREEVLPLADIEVPPLENTKDMMMVNVNVLVKLAFRWDRSDALTKFTLGPAGKHLAIRTREIDPRILVQQGAFTIHSNEEDLAGVPYHLVPPWRRAFRVPKEAKGGLRNTFERLSIRKGTLFPDLAALAEDLKERL